MKLGTPLQPQATKALLLGSGELGKEVAIALQRYGIEVIAVDRYANAPAHQVAHKAYVIDMTDADAVTALIKAEQPDFIIPELEAIATDALIAIEQQGSSKVVPNANAVRLTMNREGIRVLAAETLQLPTSAYAFAESYQELEHAVLNRIGLPCFIKPTMSSSGKGQSYVTEANQLKTAWDYAKAAGRVDTGKVIVEAKIDFDFEITLLTVRALNTQGEIETHYCAPIGHRQEKGDYRESWQPQAMSDLALQRAQDIAKKITEGLGGLGLFGVEVFVNQDQVWFSEISPRPHDTGMVTMVTQQQSEFELHCRAILGLPVDTSLKANGASAVILSTQQIENPSYQGLAQALAVPNSEIRLFGKPDAQPSRRMGVALATAATTEQAKHNAIQAANHIVITSE